MGCVFLPTVLSHSVLPDGDHPLARFGQALLRQRRRKELQTHEITLESGSLFLMRGESQRAWRHSIPKTRRTVAPRINLTYRHIMPIKGSIKAG